MFSKNLFLSLSALFATAVLISACSSSTSSSGGSGQIPTGIYAGVFNGQAQMPTRVTTTRAQLSVITPVSTADGATSQTIDNANISGTLAITGGDRCFTGGTVTSGLVNGDQMNLVIETTSSETIEMNGRVTDDSYNGTFTADDTSCFGLTGGFEFHRE